MFLKKIHIVFCFFLFLLLSLFVNNYFSKTEFSDSQNRSSISASILHQRFLENLKNIEISENPHIILDSLITSKFFHKINPEKKILFVDQNGLNEIGDSLFKILSHANIFGLYKNDYHVLLVDSLLEVSKTISDVNLRSINYTQVEVLLTDAYLLFGAHLNKGRFNRDSCVLEWNPQKLDDNWLDILSSGLINNNIYKSFSDLEPKTEYYNLLKKYLIEIMTVPDSMFFSIDDIGINNSEMLKKKLISTKDFDTTSILNDSLNLIRAIKSFQKKFHLIADGKIGAYTRQALKISKADIINYIEMDMERCRWDSDSKYKCKSEVNIPSAEFSVYGWNRKKNEDTLTLYSRVVVGKPETPTPLLKSKLNQIIIYPYWNVPFNIACSEILPHVKKDTNYLYKKGFEVINSKGEVIRTLGKFNWHRFNERNLPIRFRQKFGTDNSLGVCKFNFNNKYGVYLHDTNSKTFFKSDNRHQSHGCIRIEKYKELVLFLINESNLRISSDSIDVYFKKMEQRKIDLSYHLNFSVRYYCVQFDKKHLPTIYIDKYRLNDRMRNAIKKQT